MLSLQEVKPHPIIPLCDLGALMLEGHVGSMYAEVCCMQDHYTHPRINVSTGYAVVGLPLLGEEDYQALVKRFCFLI